MAHWHADDYGYDELVDAKIRDLIKQKKLNSVSIMATMVTDNSLKELKKAIKSNPDIVISLHVNLVEGSGIHFSVLKPLPAFLIGLLTGQVHKDALAHEVASQLDYLLSKHIPVQMIDSHQHTHALAPVAEIVGKLARKHKLQIRTYGNVKIYSYKAVFKYAVLALLAGLTSLVWDKKLTLPITWKKDSKNGYMTVMSWEAEGDIIEHQKKVTYVTHPFLPYDSNRSYERFVL
jgi:predicted glycoside hydrolase/deacetylase ChbG (UPF0249 family)